MKILHLLCTLSLFAFFACGDEAIDLSGEWQAQEFAQVCIDPTEDGSLSFEDGCGVTEFNNTLCYTMTLTADSGTYFRSENGQSLDDLQLSYSLSEEGNTISMTIDGVPRSGTYTENAIIFTGSDDGCELTQRWVRK